MTANPPSKRLSCLIITAWTPNNQRLAMCELFNKNSLDSARRCNPQSMRWNYLTNQASQGADRSSAHVSKIHPRPKKCITIGTFSLQGLVALLFPELTRNVKWTDSLKWKWMGDWGKWLEEQCLTPLARGVTKCVAGRAAWLANHARALSGMRSPRSRSLQSTDKLWGFQETFNSSTNSNYW